MVYMLTVNIYLQGVTMDALTLVAFMYDYCSQATITSLVEVL